MLDVYHRPYTPRYLVVGGDEVSKELHDTPRGTLPSEPGQEACQDYEYTRSKGACNLFLVVEPLRGWREMRVTDRRTAGDFAEFIRGLVDADYPDADKVVLVVDNLNTHSPACLYKRFEPAEACRIASKLEWHYTPEHGRWLNVAECELSALSRQCLSRRIPNWETLIDELAAWEKRRNTMQVRIDWQFTTQGARNKLKRLYLAVKECNSD